MRQIGEHLVAAELRRRGLIAAPFAGNVTLFDLLAADENGRSTLIQVKAINGPSRQFCIGQFLRVEVADCVQNVRGRVGLPLSDLVCIFVVLREPASDEFYIFRMHDLRCDIEFALGPVDSLDHASRLANVGSKMGIDATRKWPREGFTRPWPDVLEIPTEIKCRVDELWKRAGL